MFYIIVLSQPRLYLLQKTAIKSFSSSFTRFLWAAPRWWQISNIKKSCAADDRKKIQNPIWLSHMSKYLFSLTNVTWLEKLWFHVFSWQSSYRETFPSNITNANKIVSCLFEHIRRETLIFNASFTEISHTREKNWASIAEFNIDVHKYFKKRERGAKRGHRQRIE